MQADGSRASYYRIAINLIGGMINSLIGDILWYIAMYPCLQGYMGYVLTAVLLKLIENAHASGYKVGCTWESVHGSLYMGGCTWEAVHGRLHMGGCTWEAVHVTRNLAIKTTWTRC